MQPIYLLSLFASLALADFTLYVNSSNTDVNNNYLTSLHEGAGINYLFASQSIDNNVSYQYDSESQSLFAADATLIQRFFVDEKYHFVEMSIAGSTPVTFDNDKLLLNGSSDNFYLCKNIGDSYDYSKDKYDLVYYTSDVPEGCYSVEIYKIGLEAVLSSPFQYSSTSLSFSSSSSSAPLDPTVSPSNIILSSTAFITTSTCSTTSSLLSEYSARANNIKPTYISGAIALFAALI